MPDSLPSPDATALAVSGRLLDVLCSRIGRAGGCIGFDAYMDAALYEPGLGYYSNGLMPFGEQGDFITAPECGDLFARCLAAGAVSVLGQVSEPVILELGAGSGVLAADLLAALDAAGALPVRYLILERSTALRERQREMLSRKVPGLAARVAWLEALPAQPFNGLVFGNEVADALPVTRFCWRDGAVSALGVGCAAGELRLCEQPMDPQGEARVRALAREFGWQGEYRSEYCPALPAWVESLAGCLQDGLLLLIDYGYGRAEYYHPQRSMGTMMCHYRHNAHHDPLRWPGLQDITAFVDFTAVAEAATAAGLQLEGYTSQARFLAASGIDRLLAEVDPQDMQRFLALSNQAKRLMLPGDMGERFKVIGLSRGLRRPVAGFARDDLRSRL